LQVTLCDPHLSA